MKMATRLAKTCRCFEKGKAGTRWPMHLDCYRPLCSPLAHSFSSCTTWTKCGILLTRMSWKSPGFIKWQPRCLNLNVAKANAVSDACLHVSCSVLFTSPSSNRFPFKWKCWWLRCNKLHPYTLVQLLDFIHLINAQNNENIKLIIWCVVSEFEARRNMPTLLSI